MLDTRARAREDSGREELQEGDEGSQGGGYSGGRPGNTYSGASVPAEDEVEDLMEGEAVSVDACCSLGDEGAEESGVAISSMSE